jgi:hypothetical protein
MEYKVVLDFSVFLARLGEKMIEIEMQVMIEVPGIPQTSSSIYRRTLGVRRIAYGLSSPKAAQS